jgi:hypothetical protein
MADDDDHSRAGPASMESGKWEGEFIDSSGQRAVVRIYVDNEGDVRAGRFELVFKTEDEPFVVSGACEMRISGQRVQFEVPARDAKDQQSTVLYSASLSDAGTHARQALYGTIDEPPVDGLNGGVFIAFRYDDRDSTDRGFAAPVDDVPPRMTVDDVLIRLRRRIGRIRLPVIRGGR